MLNAQATATADGYWAEHLGCSRAQLFASPLHLVTHSAELTDYHGIFALFRDGAAVASLPPGDAAGFRTLLAPLASGCTPASFATAFSRVADAVVGPARTSYATEVTRMAGNARVLCSDDAAALRLLEAACDRTDWEHGGSAIEQPVSGAFVGRRLVAVSSYEVWGKRIAHLSVVTHPAHRGQGHAREVVSHAAQCAIQAGLLPQYRTLESNLVSIRVGEALGFREYAASVAIRLKPAAVG